MAVIPVFGKGNLAKWHRLFTAYEIPCYVIFDNDGDADDKKKVKRRDALLALGIDDEETQAGYLDYDDTLVLDEFAIFGTNFESVLRAKFPKYEEVEKQGRQQGVDSKPFLARYVAGNLAKDQPDGWVEMKTLAANIRDLI